MFCFLRCHLTHYSEEGGECGAFLELSVFFRGGGCGGVEADVVACVFGVWCVI